MKPNLNNSISFEAYFEALKQHSESGTTSGENQSEMLIEYTHLNYKRVKKWSKIYKPSEAILDAVNQLSEKELWIVLTEAWCGDAAQNIAQLAKIAEQSELIELHILYRDENLELMDKFLTNGGRSIPKLIRYQPSSESYLNTWGPRPKAAQELVMQHKADETPYAEDLHKWYALNKNQDLEQELIDLMSN
ncbi:MAG: thioredoxin family protein [Flavobacteriales bacterium]